MFVCVVDKDLDYAVIDMVGGAYQWAYINGGEPAGEGIAQNWNPIEEYPHEAVHFRLIEHFATFEQARGHLDLLQTINALPEINDAGVYLFEYTDKRQRFAKPTVKLELLMGIYGVSYE